MVECLPVERLGIKAELEGVKVVQTAHVLLEQRAVSLLLQAIPERLTTEIVSTRMLGPTMIFYKLLTVYQPGGAHEGSTMLNFLVQPSSATSVSEAIKGVRQWAQWRSRLRELRANEPDATLLIKGLDALSSTLLAKHPTVHFRVASFREKLGVDYSPTSETATQLAEMLQAEFAELYAAVLALKATSGSITLVSDCANFVNIATSLQAHDYEYEDVGALDNPDLWLSFIQEVKGSNRDCIFQKVKAHVKDNDTSQPAAFTKGNARADALAKACAKEEAARKLAELQPLILRAIDIQTHLVATLISRKDDTGIDCELETPSFYVSGGAKRVSITCSCQPRTRCRVKQPVVCRGDCINVFAGRVEALFCRSVEQGGVPERTLLCKLGVVHPTLNRAMTSPVLASAALPLLDILPIKVGGAAVHQEVLAQMSAFVSDGKWSWGSRHTVGRCCWVLLLVDFVASFGLHRSFIHSRLPIGKAVRRFRDLMLHILALHGCKAEAVTGLSTLKTVGLGHTSGLTCLRRFSHPNAIWCFVLRLGNKVVPKPSHKKSIASLIPDWSFLSVGLPSL